MSNPTVKVLVVAEEVLVRRALAMELAACLAGRRDGRDGSIPGFSPTAALARNLALYPVINLYDFLSGLLFIFGVLHQEASNGCAQCRLAFLKGGS